MRRDDWLLAQLPVGMVEDDFFVRFVSIFQELATSLLEGADNIDSVLDPTVAPDSMVRWLGSWIGTDTIDPTLPVELQRRTVRTAARTLAWRGTRRGLVEFLTLLSRSDVEVEDSGGVYPEGGAPEDPPWVSIRVGGTGGLTDRDFLALVRDQVPAHAYTEVHVGDRRIWPPPERADSIRALESAP
ncbi:MAG: phage tail protein [Frankiales bacterium]|nr:phage tail protein [Frankiales bacterium]